jgi:hypothetical protein
VKIAIHQPEHMPWPGFFNKIKNVDIFVLLDDVQYRKNYFQNRNKILDVNFKDKWITIPVEKQNIIEKINKKKIFYSEDCKSIDKIFNILDGSYKNAKFYSLYRDDLYGIYNKRFEYLSELNIAIIDYLKKILNIKTKLIKSSDLNYSGSKSDLILSICKSLNAKEYLSGISGIEYLNIKEFEKSNIDVTFQKYKFPQYLSGLKVPNLSVVDMIFRLGQESTKYI